MTSERETKTRFCRYCKVQPVEPYVAVLIDEGVYCRDCADELEQQAMDDCNDDQSWGSHDR